MYECQRDSLANPGHDLAKDSTKDLKGQKCGQRILERS